MCARACVRMYVTKKIYIILHETEIYRSTVIAVNVHPASRVLVNRSTHCRHGAWRMIDIFEIAIVTTSPLSLPLPLPSSLSSFPPSFSLSLSMQATSLLPSCQILLLFDVSYKTLMTGFTFYPCDPFFDVRCYLNVSAKTRSGRIQDKKLGKQRKDINIFFLSSFLLSRYNSYRFHIIQKL